MTQMYTYLLRYHFKFIKTKTIKHDKIKVRLLSFFGSQYTILLSNIDLLKWIQISLKLVIILIKSNPNNINRFSIENIMVERINLSQNIDKFFESLRTPQIQSIDWSERKKQSTLQHAKSCPQQHKDFAIQSTIYDKNYQERAYSNPQLVLVRNSQQLQQDFQQSKTIIASLNLEIDDLFKKITQLTDQVSANLTNSEMKKCKSPQKKQKQNYIKRNAIPSPFKFSNKSFIKESKQPKKKQQFNVKDLFKTFQPIQFFPIENKSLKTSDFQFGKVLGYGKFGQAIHCKNNKTGLQCVIKKIFKSTISEYQMEKQLNIQLQALKRLNHPNIIQTYSSFTDQFHVFIVMQYAHGNSLIKMFNSSQELVSQIIKQVLLAIQYMHKTGVVHRDIKPQNIIINEQNQIKICDLGWASLDGKQLNICCGTLDYISPEMTENKPYTQKIDLWNVGILTYQLLFGKVPFKGFNKKQTIEKVKTLQFEYPRDKKISNQCKQFIEGFLQKQPSRKSVKWGLQHSFITKHSKKFKQCMSVQIYNDFQMLFY